MTIHDRARAAAEAVYDAELEALEQRAVAAETAAANLDELVVELRRQLEERPVPTPTATTRIGMSAPANLWDQRLAEVGPEGVTARRIFATELSIKGRLDEIGDALRAGMLPILSFKGTPTPANVANLRHELEALGADVTATWHHEPRGDWSGADFCRHSETFLGVKSARVQVGPILNGWLLDNKVAEWESFTTPALLDAWDFLGVDTYQPSADSPKYPGRTIPKMVDWLAAKGHPDKPIVVGEYNGFTAEAIRESGETFLSTPQVVAACCWNSTGKPGSQEHIPLAGDRLAAFRATKADARAAR